MNLIEDRALKWKKAVECVESGDAAGGLFLCKSLENEGSEAALVEIGNIYETGGDGVTQDFVEAAKWYRKSIDETSDIEAYLAYARLHYLGLGVKQDYEKALFYYNKLEDENEPIALLALGRIYHYGFGVEKNYAKAKEYYSRAIALGNKIAIKNLGYLYLNYGKPIKGAITLSKAIVVILSTFISNRNSRSIRVY